MPIMTIRVINATFESLNTGEYDTVDDAFRVAVAAGLEIAANEVATKLGSAIVQVAVDQEGRTGIATGAVAVSMERFVDLPVKPYATNEDAPTY